MTTLNPRPARPMTDREIVNILGGVIGGLIEAQVTTQEIKSAVRSLRTLVLGQPLPGDTPQGPWVAALCGVVGGIIHYCKDRDIFNALDWILENWSDIVSDAAPTDESLCEFVEAHGETAPDPQIADQTAREQLGRDLIDAYHAAYDVSDGAATLYIELGLRPEAMGQFGMVGSMLGMVLGVMVDFGCTFDDLQRVLLGGNRAALDALPIAQELRAQALTFLDFGLAQLETLCKPGSSQAVLAALIGIFTRTMGAIGMGPSPAVH